ncbi:uracil-DNA glycosylase, partial [Methylobacterium sp. WL64]
MLTSMPSPTDAQADLIAYLDFHVEAGADAVLDERPHDRFGEADTPAPTLRAPRRPAASPRPAA